MIRLTVTIGPAPGGIGVNCRQDGTPADSVEEFWLQLVGNAIKGAMIEGRDALIARGVLAAATTRSGEAARIAGEKRHGAPGEAGGN